MNDASGGGGGATALQLPSLAAGSGHKGSKGAPMAADPDNTVRARLQSHYLAQPRLRPSSGHALITAGLHPSSGNTLITPGLHPSSTHTLITPGLHPSAAHTLITPGLHRSSGHTTMLCLHPSSRHTLITPGLPPLCTQQPWAPSSSALTALATSCHAIAPPLRSHPSRVMPPSSGRTYHVFCHLRSRLAAPQTGRPPCSAHTTVITVAGWSGRTP